VTTHKGPPESSHPHPHPPYQALHAADDAAHIVAVEEAAHTVVAHMRLILRLIPLVILRLIPLLILRLIRQLLIMLILCRIDRLG